MTAIGWIKTNRLKMFSFCAVAGDCLTSLSGTVAAHGFLLMLGGALALFGHGVLFAWGKGAKDKAITSLHDNAVAPIAARPFLPWRYPLDTGFLLFAISAMLYIVWGIITPNMAMMIVGMLLCAASLIGWLCPQDRIILGLRAVQVTAAMYVTASVSTFIAGMTTHNHFITASSCIYIIGNAILFTTRKEHQSAYTQTHQ